MLDYHRWIRRAVEFINSIPPLPGEFEISGAVLPPIDDAAVDRLAKRCRLPIPDSLRRFWMTGASGANLRYHWALVPLQFEHQMRMASGDRFGDYLWGGLEMLSADEVAHLSHEIPSWAEGMSPEYPKDSRIWGHSLPLVPVGNGDYVGLYVRDDLIDPPVVYMCHEGAGGSDILAVNLDDFLQGWEQLCYISMDFLVNYCDPGTDRLAVDLHPVQAAALQALLRGDVRDDLELPPDVLSEQDWLTARNPDRLLEWLDQHGLQDERKLRLYCCACCQRVSNQMGDTGRHAVEVSRRYADGEATAEELASAREALSGGVRPDPFAGSLNSFMESAFALADVGRREGLMHGVAYSVVDAHSWVSSEITQHLDDPERAAEEAAHAELVRHIFGNPFRSVSTITEHSAAIKRLAERLYEGDAVSSEMAAALQDEGDIDLAEHFRSSDHPRGCWALDLILGK